MRKKLRKKLREPQPQRPKVKRPRKGRRPPQEPPSPEGVPVPRATTFYRPA